MSREEKKKSKRNESLHTGWSPLFAHSLEFTRIAPLYIITNMSVTWTGYKNNCLCCCCINMGWICAHTALQLEHGVDVSASQRDFLFRQKSQLRLARVRFSRGCSCDCVLLSLLFADECGCCAFIYHRSKVLQRTQKEVRDKKSKKSERNQLFV